MSNKALAAFMSRSDNYSYVCNAPTKAEKHKRIAELEKLFKQSSFSNSSVNFSGSGYVEDSGNPDFFDFTLDEVNSYPELSALGKIRRITENHRAVTDAKAHAEKKNSILRRNKERIKNGN